MGLFGPKKSPEERFWEWFSQNRSDYAAQELTRGQLKAMEKKLMRVHKDLVWEIGPLPDARWQLAISADGLKEVARHTRVLADKAPDVPGWDVVAFRQPKGPDVGPIVIRLQGADVSFGTNTVYATVAKFGSVYDLTIFADVPLEVSQDVISQLIFLLLDSTIGEHAMIYKIRYIEFAPFGQKPQNAIKLDDHPSVIDITQF